jgi:hypothetical protein
MAALIQGKKYKKHKRCGKMWYYAIGGPLLSWRRRVVESVQVINPEEVRK